jgi:uncharacterized OsmC-like protein
VTTATEPRIRNGINVDQAYGTLDAIKGQPEIAKFQFRASNTWLGGTHNRSSIKGFYGAGQEDTTRTHGWDVDAGEPGVLLGKDEGPNPAEYLLHALASCLTMAIVNVAAARGVNLSEVRSTIEGNTDLQGALGVNKEVRNGFQNIRATFVVKGDAPDEKIREIVERAKARSFVFDCITNGVPVTLDVVNS